jgi:uncharacterized protein YqeY
MLTKIEQEIKKSMIAKEATRLGVLRMVKADLVNNTKQAKQKNELMVVNEYLNKLKKTKEISITHNIDVASLDNEISIVEEFLPPAVTEAEVEAELTEIMKTESHIGPIMNHLRSKFPTADGKMLNQAFGKRPKQ